MWPKRPLTPAAIGPIGRDCGGTPFPGRLCAQEPWKWPGQSQGCDLLLQTGAAGQSAGELSSVITQFPELVLWRKWEATSGPAHPGGDWGSLHTQPAVLRAFRAWVQLRWAGLVSPWNCLCGVICCGSI